MDRIAEQKADESDLENLANIMDMLEDIGSTKVITDIDDIIKAGKRGHWAFAADSTEKTQSSYEKLRNRIVAAKKTEGDDAPPAGYEKQSLKNAVAQIESGEAARKLRVLAVDDSTVMLNTISSILGGDYKVYGMAKPTMVEKFLEQITPDLILLDYEMPEINGFELIPIIRKFEEHKDTPIIFLTSLGTMEHVSAAAKLGACDFIVKPFQTNNKREKVSKHIVWKD
jgi:PleD family two-component response regulator